jgi:hypothetical protein
MRGAHHISYLDYRPSDADRNSVFLLTKALIFQWKPGKYCTMTVLN